MKQLNLVANDSQFNIQELAVELDALLEDAVVLLNQEFASLSLIKGTRAKEPLPTEPKQFSSYRTRMGIMMEYAVNHYLGKIINNKENNLSLTFVSANQYPDFFIRNKNLEVKINIEVKAVDADSDEQAARFDVPTEIIDSEHDLLMLLAWKWEDLVVDGEIRGERPQVYAHTVVAAGDIADERDKRLKITGGKIENGEAYVFSKKKQVFVLDPGNYGKFWRIVHSSRHEHIHNDSIKRFLLFLEAVSVETIRKRLSGR